MLLSNLQNSQVGTETALLTMFNLKRVCHPHDQDRLWFISLSCTIACDLVARGWRTQRTQCTQRTPFVVHLGIRVGFLVGWHGAAPLGERVAACLAARNREIGSTGAEDGYGRIFSNRSSAANL